NITRVTWPERAAAAWAPVDVRANAVQHRSITTGMRKKSRKFICRTNIVAQNRPPGIKIELMSRDVSAEEFPLRGKNRCCSTDFFQSRNFCAAFKNKVQNFSCRFFAAFLISRLWQGARESSVVNKV